MRAWRQKSPQTSRIIFLLYALCWHYVSGVAMTILSGDVFSVMTNCVCDVTWWRQSMYCILFLDDVRLGFAQTSQFVYLLGCLRLLNFIGKAVALSPGVYVSCTSAKSPITTNVGVTLTTAGSPATCVSTGPGSGCGWRDTTSCLWRAVSFYLWFSPVISFNVYTWSCLCRGTSYKRAYLA